MCDENYILVLSLISFSSLSEEKNLAVISDSLYKFNFWVPSNKYSSIWPEKASGFSRLCKTWFCGEKLKIRYNNFCILFSCHDLYMLLVWWALSRIESGIFKFILFIRNCYILKLSFHRGLIYNLWPIVLLLISLTNDAHLVRWDQQIRFCAFNFIILLFVFVFHSMRLKLLNFSWNFKIFFTSFYSMHYKITQII